MEQQSQIVQCQQKRVSRLKSDHVGVEEQQEVRQPAAADILQTAVSSKQLQIGAIDTHALRGIVKHGIHYVLLEIKKKDAVCPVAEGPVSGEFPCHSANLWISVNAQMAGISGDSAIPTRSEKPESWSVSIQKMVSKITAAGPLKAGRACPAVDAAPGQRVGKKTLSQAQKIFRLISMQIRYCRFDNRMDPENDW